MSKVINIEFDYKQRVYFTYDLNVHVGRITDIRIKEMADPKYVSYTLDTEHPDGSGYMFSGGTNEIFETIEEARESILERLETEYEENVKIVNEKYEEKE